MTTDVHSDPTINGRIENIYHTYLNIIAPHVMRLEHADGEFPIEIINEIRSVFSHISKAYLSNDFITIDDNITKAERHIKRAILDCYKYSCLSYSDQYNNFTKMYKNVDMSMIDNGDFLPKLCKMHKECVQKKKLAQNKELEIDATDDDLYSLYEDAFFCYAEVDRMINDSYEKLERAKHKATKKDIFQNIFGVFGVIGTLVTIYELFISKLLL